MAGPPRLEGIHEPLGWLTLYFVGYAASHVLPTSVGGDAVRILDHARRRPEARGEVAGAVLMERVLGVVGTVLLLLLGLALVVGDDRAEVIGPVEAALLLAAALALTLLLFSRRVERTLAHYVFPLGRRVHLERPLASVWSALHGYRRHPGPLAAALALTLATQLARTCSVWLCCAAVGIDESFGTYVVFTALLSLVMVIPFTFKRARRSGGVLRGVLRPLRRRPGHGARGRPPVLRDHPRGVGAGRADPALALPVRRGSATSYQ